MPALVSSLLLTRSALLAFSQYMKASLLLFFGYVPEPDFRTADPNPAVTYWTPPPQAVGYYVKWLLEQAQSLAPAELCPQTTELRRFTLPAY
jgi:hypothetical protein